MAESAATQGRVTNRWLMLVFCVIAMMAIANLQYAWTNFTGPLTKALNAKLSEVQFAFTAFTFCETWLVPFETYLVERLGTRLMLGVAAILVGLGWIGSGMVHSLGGLYFWYAVGGIGAGAVYGTCIGTALKWFPDKRGLCVGLTAGAYGIGTALTLPPITHQIASSGYQSAFITWGTIQGLIVLVSALIIQQPPKGWAPPGWAEKEKQIRQRVHMSTQNYTPLQVVTKPAFWLMYLMMTLVAFGGLVMTAQLAPIAKSFGMDKLVLFGGLSALVWAQEVDRYLNGLTRPFWGWVSDHIGRENTMALAFTSEALMILLWTSLIHHPLAFILLSGFVFFAWGEIYSLFPATIGDIFGQQYASTNYGLLYTAKGTASLLAGSGAAWLYEKLGNWVPVFYVGICCDLIAAALAWFWLRKLVASVVSQRKAAVATAGAD